MTDTTYNGWSNYETWRINLEVCDDYCSSLIDDGTVFDSESDLARNLQDYVETMIDDDGGNGFAASLANSFISDVNWYEIAEHYDGELFNIPPTCDDCGEKFSHLTHTEWSALGENDPERCDIELSEMFCDACSIDVNGYCRACAARNE